MAIVGTPEYQPSIWQKTKIWISQRAPSAIGRALQLLFYWLWKAVQFIIQMFHDAIGK
jgi:hypothetical protein